MKFLYIIFGLMYVSTLIMIIKKYIEIGKKTEYYDSMEAIYQYDPRLRNLKGYELSRATRECEGGNYVVVIVGMFLSVINTAIYYLIRTFLRPQGSVILLPELEGMGIVFITGSVFYSVLVYCLCAYAKSGFWQLVALHSLTLDNGTRNCSKSRALRRQLLMLGGIFVIYFPAHFLYTFDYTYLDGEKIVSNTLFNLHEEVYQLDKCKGVVLRYEKRISKHESHIEYDLHIIRNDGMQLRLGDMNSEGTGRECSSEKRMLVSEKLFDYGVQLIKPDMTEVEFYAVLDCGGEDFLQFYYPELCEQYGIFQEE